VSGLESEIAEADVSFMRLNMVSSSPVIERPESDDMPEWEEMDEHEELENTHAQLEDVRPFRNSFHSWSEYDLEHAPMSPNRFAHELYLAELGHLGKVLRRPGAHDTLQKIVAESRGESVTKDNKDSSSWDRKCMETMAAWIS